MPHEQELPLSAKCRECRTPSAEFGCLVTTEHRVARGTASYVTDSRNLTDDQIEPEAVGGKDRIHPPPGIVHQDDNLEDKTSHLSVMRDLNNYCLDACVHSRYKVVLDDGH